MHKRHICNTNSFFSQQGIPITPHSNIMQYEPSICNLSIISDAILSILGQMIVTMFLAYSGFGIMNSYINKGISYRNGFLRKRVVKILAHFDIAVALFLFLSLALGTKYTTKEYILSFIGWESIGNSNWFVFDIIILYVISFIGFHIVEKLKLNIKHYVFILTVLCFMFLEIMNISKDGALWWFDTIMAFLTGMMYCAYRHKIEQHLTGLKWWIAITMLTAIYVILWIKPGMTSAIFSPIVFALLLISLTMKLKISNGILHWLGVNAFAIYILQRIPMIVFSHIGLSDNQFIFLSLVIPATLLMSWGFTHLTGKIDKKLFC